MAEPDESTGEFLRRVSGVVWQHCTPEMGLDEGDVDRLRTIADDLDKPTPPSDMWHAWLCKSELGGVPQLCGLIWLPVEQKPVASVHGLGQWLRASRLDGAFAAKVQTA